MMTSELRNPEEIAEIKVSIQQQSEFNATNIREIILHFQALKSARASRLMMDAPGLYLPELTLYVISKSGTSRGHATLKNNLISLVGEACGPIYGFVLYPESYVRSCLDRILRRTVRQVCPEMRLSMENVFNKKFHGGDLTDSAIEKDLILLLKKDLG